MYSQDLKKTLVMYPNIKEVGFDPAGNHYLDMTHVAGKVDVVSREEILEEEFDEEELEEKPLKEKIEKPVIAKVSKVTKPAKSKLA